MSCWIGIEGEMRSVEPGLRNAKKEIWIVLRSILPVINLTVNLMLELESLFGCCLIR